MVVLGEKKVAVRRKPPAAKMVLVDRNLPTSKEAPGKQESAHGQDFDGHRSATVGQVDCADAPLEKGGGGETTHGRGVGASKQYREAIGGRPSTLKLYRQGFGVGKRQVAALAEGKPRIRR